MKKTVKALTFFDVVLLLFAVLLLSLFVHSLLSSGGAKQETVPMRMYVCYEPLVVGEALPEAGERLLNENGDEVGQVIAATLERDGSVYVQLRVSIGTSYEVGASFPLETASMIRHATVLEQYPEEIEQ